MNTLTKEHFDERIDTVDKRLNAMDKRFKAVNERFDTVDQRFDALAAMIARGFDDITKRLDIRERVDSLEKKMTKVESALNVQL